jgi:hypothetical protein
VIRIRYSDIQPGLHAQSAREGRHTVIYLVPGLSPTQRSNAIGRLKSSSRVGHGPNLPAIPLAAALIIDHVKGTLRNAAAAARLHPVGVLIPMVLLGTSLILYCLLVTVSIRLGPPSVAGAILGPGLQPVAAAPGQAAPARHGARDHDPVSSPRASLTRAARVAGSASHKARSPQPMQYGSPKPVPSGKVTPHPSTSPRPSSHPTSPPPSVPPSPSPSPHPSRSGGGGGGLCLNLGFLGVCVDL